MNVYADGSCPKPHAPGGWAFALLLDDHNETNIYGSGRVDIATNNTMEVAAIVEAMKAILKNRILYRPVIIHSDSQYAVKGLNNWVHQWELNDFEGVANADMWREALAIKRKFKHGSVHCRWVKGHAGNFWNCFCDELAGTAQKGRRKATR
jgi:ribonuclease HI